MSAPLETGTHFAGYTIEGILGRGGMGVVYLAEQQTLGRRVALKVIAPQYANDEEFRERFKRESRVAASIEHPHAITIHEAGAADDGTLYLVMRYIEGTDLRSLIQAEGQLEPLRAARIVEQVGGALDEAHSRGLVHRDVKPANVLISSSRGSDHAYLTDFGLTKQTSATGGLTATGQWLGTIDYSSPEQIHGRRVDARTDVYALGCVLFEAITGSVPFERDSDVAKLFAHANEPPPAPGTVVPGLPSGLNEVVSRALEKSPDDRYASAGDLGRAAVAAASGESTAVRERTVAAGPAAPSGASTVAADRGAIPEGPTTDAETVVATGARSGRIRSRRLAALAGLAALAVGGVAAAIATGVIGGDDDTGGDGSGTGEEQTTTAAGLPENLYFETMSTPAYTVEVPGRWDQVEIEAPAGDPPGSFLRTELLSRGGELRLAISRIPGGETPPSESAEAAEAENVGEEGYEQLRFEPVTLGEREAFLWQFNTIDDDLGDGQAVAYFFNADGDAYRVQATAAKGGDRFSQLPVVAERAAETLQP